MEGQFNVNDSQVCEEVDRMKESLVCGVHQGKSKRHVERQ